MWQLRYAPLYGDGMMTKSVHDEETSECTLLAIGFQLVMITTRCIMMECVCVWRGGYVLAGPPFVSLISNYRNEWYVFLHLFYILKLLPSTLLSYLRQCHDNFISHISTMFNIRNVSVIPAWEILH